MIKLERIYVQNYKNIAEADLPLGQMNVIVGENNAGKSNLLKAITLLNHIINGEISNVKYGFKNYGDFELIGRTWNNESSIFSDEPLIIRLDILNTQTNIYYTYEIQLKKEFKYKKGMTEKEIWSQPFTTKIVSESFYYKKKSQTGKAISIFKRANNEVDYGNTIKKNETISTVDSDTSTIRILGLIRNSPNVSQIAKDALSGLFSILNSKIYYLSSQAIRGAKIEGSNEIRIIGFPLVEEISISQKSSYWNEYKEALQQILDIQTIEITEYKVAGGFVVIRINQNGIWKSLYDLSDGTMLLLALITKIFSDTSDILFIEEPENSIHPNALNELMKLIKRQSLDKQFIITTHSPYLLNMIKPEDVFVAERQENGLSKITKLPNIKAIRKKLAKSFMNFGDIVFAEPQSDEDDE